MKWMDMLSWTVSVALPRDVGKSRVYRSNWDSTPTWDV